MRTLVRTHVTYKDACKDRMMMGPDGRMVSVLGTVAPERSLVNLYTGASKVQGHI